MCERERKFLGLLETEREREREREREKVFVGLNKKCSYYA